MCKIIIIITENPNYRKSLFAGQILAPGCMFDTPVLEGNSSQPGELHLEWQAAVLRANWD